jgi:hypothetical protein
MGTIGWIRDFRHPELGEGEQFLGNFTVAQFNETAYKIKRLGKVAYDQDGKVIPPSSELTYPMFVSAGEYAARLKELEERPELRKS